MRDASFPAALRAASALALAFMIFMLCQFAWIPSDLGTAGTEVAATPLGIACSSHDLDNSVRTIWILVG